jgi:hypothetical protein
MGKRAPLRPSWTASVGTMMANGITAKAYCDRCGQWSAVDLARIAVIKGEDFDLWNRSTRCTLTDGCSGRVKFLHSGQGVMRPMRD